MGSNQRNIRLILEGEDDEAIYTLEATLEPRNQPINLGRTERTISVEPLVDAPIVPTKSAEVAEVKPQTKTYIPAQTTTSEINIAALILGGIMIGSMCFAGGYIIATEQHRANTLEVIK